MGNAVNDDVSVGQLDVGTGFGRKAPTYLAALTEVGPGTPMGNLLRRYWHPVGLASHATDDAARGPGARAKT